MPLRWLRPVGLEDAVREPVLAHELPDVLDRVQLRALGRQRHEGDVWRDDQALREVPSGLVEEKHGVGSWRDRPCDLGKGQVHGLGVAGGPDQGRALALSRTDRAEDVGRGGTLIVGRRRPGAAPRPAPGDLVLLADPRFVGEPELYPAWFDALLPRDLVKTPREAYGMARPFVELSAKLSHR